MQGGRRKGIEIRVLARRREVYPVSHSADEPAQRCDLVTASEGIH
jgi:hypothetical protein